MDSSILFNKFDNLPDFAKKEILDFIDYLSDKYGNKSKEPQKAKEFNFDWEGAISDYSKQYTSLELQKKANEWRSI